MRISQWVWNVLIWNSLWFKILLLVIKHIKDLLDSHKSGKPFTTKIFAKYSREAQRLGLLLTLLESMSTYSIFYFSWRDGYFMYRLIPSFGASQVMLGINKPTDNSGDIRDRFSPWVGKIPWKRTWEFIFLPAEFHGQRNLVGYIPWITQSQAQLSN